MKRLPKIHSGLARLRLFRSTVRLGMMGSTVLSILLWAMAGAFLLDFWIHMDQLERVIVLLSVIGVAGWAFFRFLAPVLKGHESDTALAVMVDGMHGMHSDLVGALQFDDEKRSQYGSTQLRDAVVEYTGQAAGELNFLEGFSRKELFNRLFIFVLTAVICLTPAVIYSQHTGIFLKRMVLFEARYPTRTSIKVISPIQDYRQAEGQSVEFKIHARHVSGPSGLPESGQVRIEAVNSGLETTVELTRKGGKDDVPAVYSGTLNNVMDDLSYIIYLGDTRSDSRRMTLVPRPRVELDMEIITPEYARGKAPPKSKNRRQAVVVEGSKVIPIITCGNKEIVKGTITFEKSDKAFPLTRRGKTLVFDSDTGPLARVGEMVRFEIDIIDIDDQHPESPIKGVVHISADLPPGAVVMGYSPRVVPEAKPELRFKATDDYALAEITLHMAVTDADGQQTEEPVKILAKLKGARTEYIGSYKVNLSNLKVKVQKGYQVAAWIEAVDYRGEVEGKRRRSAKWIFEITDSAGVIDQINLLTKEMDKKLDEILRNQEAAAK